MKYKITTVIFAIFFLISASLFINQLQINKDIELGKNVVSDWACMDGCFNMLEVIYINIDYSNETLKNYHTQCSDKCFDKFALHESKDDNNVKEVSE